MDAPLYVFLTVVGSSSKMGLEIVPDWQQNAYQKVVCLDNFGSCIEFTCEISYSLVGMLIQT